jgi:hypothetical protein
MNKKCFPHSELSDLPPDNMSETCSLCHASIPSSEMCMLCNPLPEKTPKMPHLMKNVYRDIHAHPRYKELDEVTRFAYGMGCKGEGSWGTKENNIWVRRIWRKLYLDWNTQL